MRALIWTARVSSSGASLSADLPVFLGAALTMGAPSSSAMARSMRWAAAPAW